MLNRLSVVSKDTISPFPPYLPDPPIFKKNKALRNYIISKCNFKVLSLLFYKNTNLFYYSNQW